MEENQLFQLFIIIIIIIVVELKHLVISETLVISVLCHIIIIIIEVSGNI